MSRKLPVPEIPPLPSRRSGVGACLVLARIVPAKPSRQPEQPDLLEAFWGDGGTTGEVAETGDSRDRRRSAGRPCQG